MAWELNNLEISTKNSVLEGEVLEEILKKVNQRKGYDLNDSEIFIPRYFYRIIGIENSEEDYYNYLYTLDKELTKLGKLYLSLKDGLPNVEATSEFDKNFSIVWNKICSFEDITSENVTLVIRNSELLPKFPNEVLEKQLYENMIGTLDYYMEVNNQELDPVEFKRLLREQLLWLNKYFYNLFISFDYGGTNPKVLYYGTIDCIQAYFLIFLSSLGCDILYFNPLTDDTLSLVDFNEIFSHQKNLNRRVNLEPFPKEKIVDRLTTVAFEASKSIDKALHSDESLCYKPWQLTAYKPIPVTLKSTYDEIYLWLPEESKTRLGFNVEDGCVYLPNIFCKVSGTTENLSTYWKQVNSITNLEQEVMFFDKFPIIGVSYDQSKGVNFLKNLMNEMLTTREERFVLEKICREISRLKLPSELTESCLKTHKDWPYGNLRDTLQESIARNIVLLWNKPRVKNSTMTIDEIRCCTLLLLLNIPNEFLETLMRFDYAFSIPKLVLYINEKSGELSFFDCILLSFLNLMCLDIVIYTPSGYNDIENYIEEKYYDIHKLKNIQFNLKYKGKSLFSKLFS